MLRAARPSPRSGMGGRLMLGVRKAYRELVKSVRGMQQENDQLKDKNAKLRELVADMWPFVEGAMDDEYCPAPECPFTELCTENQVCMASSGFHYRMRELGVEL